MPKYIVHSPAAITLAGGRPAAPGEVVTADPKKDAVQIAAGVLRKLEPAKTEPAPKGAPEKEES